MRTAMVGGLAVVALLATEGDAEARQCRCGHTVEQHRVHAHRAVPADVYRGPASNYAASAYSSRGGIGAPSWPRQYVSYDTEHPGRCGPDRRWKDGRCVNER